MREIKFRVYDPDAKVMELVGAIDWKYDFTGILTCNTKTRKHYFGHCKELDPVIMQFIGVKDKNGIDIYERDIVTAWSEGYCGKFEIKMREDGGGSPTWLLYPAWQNRETWSIAASREKDGFVYDRGLEIIGNIYENPELLNIIQK